MDCHVTLTGEKTADPGAPRRGFPKASRREDTGGMSETSWMMNREVQCRCGKEGVIIGVEEVEDEPALVWVSHPVRLAMQTHIHRRQQMPALLAQLAEEAV